MGVNFWSIIVYHSSGWSPSTSGVCELGILHTWVIIILVVTLTSGSGASWHLNLVKPTWEITRTWPLRNMKNLRFRMAKMRGAHFRMAKMHWWTGRTHLFSAWNTSSWNDSMLPPTSLPDFLWKSTWKGWFAGTNWCFPKGSPISRCLQLVFYWAYVTQTLPSHNASQISTLHPSL